MRLSVYVEPPPPSLFSVHSSPGKLCSVQSFVTVLRIRFSGSPPPLNNSKVVGNQKSFSGVFFSFLYGFSKFNLCIILLTFSLPLHRQNSQQTQAPLSPIPQFNHIYISPHKPPSFFLFFFFPFSLSSCLRPRDHISPVTVSRRLRLLISKWILGSRLKPTPPPLSPLPPPSGVVPPYPPTHPSLSLPLFL